MIQQPLFKRDSEIDRNLKWKTYISYIIMYAHIYTHTATIKSTRISCLEIHGALVFSIFSASSGVDLG